MGNAGKRRRFHGSGRVIFIGVSLVFFLGWLVFPESVRTFRNAAARYLNLAPEPQVQAYSNLLVADQPFAPIGRGDTVNPLGPRSAWAGEELSAAPSTESKSAWRSPLERGVRVPAPAALLSVALLVVGIALLDHVWNHAAARGRSLDRGARLRATVLHFTTWLRGGIEPNHGPASIVRIVPARASAVFLLALGFFIGWLTAPDFIRRQESSVAESLAISSAGPSRMLNEFATWLGAAGMGSIGQGASHGDSPATALIDSMPQALDLEVVSGESDNEESLGSPGIQEAVLNTKPRADQVSGSPVDFGDSPRAILSDNGFLAGEPDSMLFAARFVAERGSGQPSNSFGQGNDLRSPVGNRSGTSPSSPRPGDSGPPVSQPPVSEPPPEPPRQAACAPEDVLCRIHEQTAGILSPGEILAQFSPFASSEEIASTLAENGATLAECSSINDYCRLLVSPDADIPKVVKALLKNSAVANAEPNYLFQTAAIAIDPLYPAQWSLAKIGASGAWDAINVTTRSKVAVLDTGFDVQHPDLAQVWTTTINVVEGGTDVSGNSDHGTAVAGVLAALGDNAYGIAGVNKKWVDLILVKVFGDGAYANSWDIANGIDEAAQAGAQVVNLSMDGPFPADLLCGAIKDRYGMLFVSAAGNRGTDEKRYPAACGDDDQGIQNIIAVASTDVLDELASSSSRGFWVHLAAPGEDILTDAPFSLFTVSSGTSMAAPHVAGVASMLFAKDAGATVSSVKSQIVNTVDNLGLYVSTGGRLNACRALGACP